MASKDERKTRNHACHSCVRVSERGAAWFDYLLLVVVLAIAVLVTSALLGTDPATLLTTVRGWL